MNSTKLILDMYDTNILNIGNFHFLERDNTFFYVLNLLNINIKHNYNTFT